MSQIDGERLSGSELSPVQEITLLLNDFMVAGGKDRQPEWGPAKDPRYEVLVHSAPLDNDRVLRGLQYRDGTTQAITGCSVVLKGEDGRSLEEANWDPRVEVADIDLTREPLSTLRGIVEPHETS